MSSYGEIEVIYGPMFSGKSSQLLRKVKRYQFARKKCLVINYLHDNRYSSEEVMSTHDRQTHKAIKTSSLQEVKSKAKEFDIVAIDEGQFFTDIVEFSEEMADLGINVLIAALDGTFQRKPFGNIINLLPIAQKVTKLTAVCVYCSKEAAFTKRVVESQEIELIGGEEEYKPVCRLCFKTDHKDRKQNRSEVRIQESKNKEIKTSTSIPV